MKNIQNGGLNKMKPYALKPAIPPLKRKKFLTETRNTPASLKEQTPAKDMTEGSPMKLIIQFAVPLLFGYLFQQFYSLVDTVIVGRFLGVNALASVGATGSINFLIIGFCMGVCNGFAIPVAQCFGAKDETSLRKYVANGVWLSGIFAIIMTFIVTILCRDILIWMKTPSDILEGAYQYIVIIFIGIPVTYLYNMLSGIIRSLGDSKTPVLFLTLSSVLNILLDLFCIIELHMGVAGAAVATVISQGVSGILCFLYMKKKFTILKLTKEDWTLHPYYIKNLLNMGVPMGLQYSITAIGSVILQSAVNTLGSLAVAAVTAGSKIGAFFCCPFDAMGSTMATYGGQNVGAGKLDRLGKGLRSCIVLGSSYAILAFLFLLFFGKNLAVLFIEPDQMEILSNVHLYLLLNSGFYIPLALVNIIRFLIQGMGFSRFAILSGLFEMIARTLVACLFVPIWGFQGACLANAVAWLFADLFLIPAFFYCRKRMTTINHSKTTYPIK